MKLPPAARATAPPPPASAAAPALRQPAAFAAAVIDWQRAHGRHDLPWQTQPPDPYRVWLSEIMLQQTQVATVRSYFTRFVERFPDVAALAAAPIDDVLALWSGLGYYHRARNLHACAQQLALRHGGDFPRSAEALQTLPGIGRSTAAAIAAFCFGERVAILDGNVRRVLARVLGFAQDLGKAANQQQLWGHATELLPRADPARTMPAYTQGMMDLGATICRTRRPACLLCPLASRCVAFQTGTQEKLPVKSASRARTEVHWWLLVLQDAGGRVWLQRRPPIGIWPGLFCPPVFDSRAALDAAAAPLAGAHALQPLPTLRHALTHRELLLHPLLLQPGMARMEVGEGDAGAWLEAQAWAGLGLPAPIRTLLDSL